MTILDHRILIPKSPAKVWDFLSDLNRNPTWQIDCVDVSVLTTRHTGTGVRWRYSTPAKREYVAEITAWYEGLGYEYTYVDGAPFRESKGRIRLQEIAEGTIVQWTLTYETRGVLAGVRNSVGIKRQFEASMVDSLKNLWKVIQKAIPEDQPREVKSLMRDAPDYQSRTQYKSRNVASKPELTNDGASVSEEMPIIEPPLAEDDTRPRVVTALIADNELSGSPGIVEDNSLEQFAVSNLTTSTFSTIGGGKPSDLPIAKIEEIIDDGVNVHHLNPVTHESQPVNLSVEKRDVHVERVWEAGDDVTKLDTAEISVFDIFGLPRPSQTQQIQPVSDDEVVDTLVTNTSGAIAPATMPRGRIGLRQQNRRKRLKLRIP